MAKPGAASVKASKEPPKPLEKAKEKAAVKAAPEAPGKAPPAAKAPATKPGDKEHPPAKSGAVPDATLLDDEAAGDAEAAAPARRGLLGWLPTGRKRWIVLGGSLVGLLVVAAAGAVGSAYFRPAPPPPPGPRVIAGPAQAIDGATLTVAGQTVHLQDIDAPPASLICRDGAWTDRCGEDARRGLDAAIGHQPVECVNPHTTGGRLAALCRNDSGLDIAAIQVESGWAVDDIRASSRYVAEEARARSDGNGLWLNDFAHPELWHKSPTAAVR